MFIEQATQAGLTKANTLTYFAYSKVTKKKVLYHWLPGVNIIKLFSFVADDEAI